jgi:guanylate kinase
MIDQRYGGQLFVISGPSGVGKGTIVQELLNIRKDVVLSVSHSSRAIRKTEVEGRDYFFVSRAEFEKMIRQGDFLEYAEVHGNYYGTSQEKLDELLKSGKNVIFEVDIQGGIGLKRMRPEVITIFILPPNEAEILKRIQKRGTETESSIQKRLNTMQQELPQAKYYDYQLINDKLQDTVKELNQIFEKHISLKRKSKERV